MAKRRYEDDDGRTVADMSDVSRPELFRPRAPEHRRETPERDPRPEERFTRQERRWYALGALKAALLIGLAYVAGLGAVIALMILLWK